MSTAIVRKALRIPGRLVATPTNLATAFPHGGTALGLTRDAELRIGFGSKNIHAEEYGGITVEAVYTGEKVIFAAVVRDLDNDMLTKVFPSTAAGAVSGDRVVSYEVDASVRSGKLLADNAFKLLWSPRAPGHHPSVLIYKAIPLVDEAALLQLSLGEEVGVAVMFVGIPDSSGRVYALGKAEDLTL